MEKRAIMVLSKSCYWFHLDGGITEAYNNGLKREPTLKTGVASIPSLAIVRGILSKILFPKRSLFVIVYVPLCLIAHTIHPGAKTRSGAYGT
jgi:hypothetical protein